MEQTLVDLRENFFNVVSADDDLGAIQARGEAAFAEGDEEAQA